MLQFVFEYFEILVIKHMKREIRILESAKISQELADFYQKIDFCLTHFPLPNIDFGRISEDCLLYTSDAADE